MSETLPKAIWTGEFTLFGVTLKCCNLDNGERVIESEGLEKLFTGTSMKNNKEIDSEEMKKFLEWQRGEG